MKFKLPSPPFQESRLYPSDHQKIPLRLVLTLPFVLQTVGTVVLVGYLSYRSGQQAVEDLASKLMQETGDRIEQNLDRYFQVPKIVVKENQAAIKLGILDWRNTSLMETYFIRQLHIQPDVNGLMISTENKHFLSVARPRPDRLAIHQRNLATGALENYAADLQGKHLYGQDTLPNYDPHPIPPTNPWYGATKKAKNGLWRPVFSIVPGKNRPLLMMTYFLPFTDPPGKWQGILSASIHFDRAGEFLRHLHISKTGQAFIIDEQGLLIATSTAELPFRQNLSTAEKKTVVPEALRLAARDSQNPVTRAAAWRSEQMGSLSGNSHLLDFRLQNKRYFAQIIPFQLDNQIDWTIVVVVPESEFIAQIQANVYRTAIISGLALLGAIAIGIWTSGRITRSLFDLTQAARDFTEGKLDRSLKPTRIIEMQALSESLSEMVTSLRQAEQLRQNYQQDLERQVAEKTALLYEAQRVAKIGSWSWNLVTDERWWSPQMYRIVGLNPKDYSVPPDLEIANQNIHPEDRERVNEMTINAIEQGISYEIEFRFLRPDGSISYIFSRGIVERNTEGQVIRFWGISQDITDRKVAEEALRQSETRLKEAQRVAHIGSWEFNLTTQEVIWSEELYRIYEAEDRIPVPRPDLTIQRIHPDDEERFQQEIMATIVSQQSFDTDLRIITQKGNIRYIQAKGQPISHVPSEMVNFSGIIADITDRKQAEAALKAKTEEVDRFFSVALDLLCIANTDGYFLRLNPQWEKTLGYRLEDLEGVKFLDYVHPEDLDRTLEAIAFLVDQREISNFVNRYRCRDGSYRWIEWRSVPLGNLIYGAARDITERKQAEISLQQALQELTYHVEHSPLATIHWNQEFRIKSWSKQAEQMFGWKAQEVLGKSLYDWQFICEDDLEAVNQVTEQLLKGFSSICHNRNYHKDGSVVYCEWYNSALLDKNGNLISMLSLVLDVTARKQAEAELAQAKEAAEAANRAKSEFLANMSHEIRTPMNAILGFSELLQDSIVNPKPRAYLKSIVSSGRTLLDLINDILDLSKIEAGKLQLQSELVSVRSLIREIEQILSQQAAQKGLSLLVEIDESVPSLIMFDGLRLRQILLNTVGNALKFTEAGFIKISAIAKSKPLSPSQRVQIEITIADTGIGISPDQQQCIFEAFQQSEGQSTRKYGGTGLGLAITKRLTELLGGTVTLQSEVGKGSAFTFIFPNLTVKDRKTPSIAPEKLDEDLNQFPTATFLVVDDVQSNLELIEGYFTGTQHRLLFATDGQEAIQVAQSHCPDVIFMDLWMPKLSGLQAAQLLKQDERTKNIPIVIVTAVSSTEEINALQAITQGFLRKPFSRSQLVSQLKQIIPLSAKDFCVDLGKTQTSQPNPSIKPAPNTLVKLPELVEKLRQEEESTWLQLSKTMKLSAIKAFNERLHQWTQEYEFQPLLDYTMTLENQLTAFDWEQLPQTIEQFTKVREQLQELLEKYK